MSEFGMEDVEQMSRNVNVPSLYYAGEIEEGPQSSIVEKERLCIFFIAKGVHQRSVQPQ
jgi:hypothetical protein